MEILIGILALIFLGIIIGLALNIFWLAFALVLYFVPTIIAAYRKHPHTLWIIPLLWAFDADKILMDFIEYRKAKNAKDAVIEGEVVKEETENKDC